MNKKRIILSSICVLLLISLIGGTFAWFYVNEDVTVGYGNSVFCEAGDSLEISLVENDTTGRWSSSIDYSAGDFTLVDISGNGAKLYRPTEINEFQQPDAMVEAISSMEDSKNYDFIEIKLAFRSVSKMNVYLHKDSFIKPVNPNDTTSNIFGKFSRGYIAGAMRVAVLDDETGELLMLWAPNSTYHLIDNQNGTYSFKTDSTPEENYSYYAEQEEGILEQVVSSEMYASKQFVVDSTGAEKEHAGNSPVLISLNPVSEGAYAEKRVRIRVWFEGTDREAHQALAGGNVNIKLKFVGVAKEVDADKQAAINNITFENSAFSGLATGMVFSTDGRTWSTTVPNGATLQSGTSIYVKYPETETHYETDYIKFTKVD